MSDQLRDATKMIDRLPYHLTHGVTATREGLAINIDLDYAYRLLVVLGVDALNAPYDSGLNAIVLPWPDAAERLRYREGEPWCLIPFDPWEREYWVNMPSSDSPKNLSQPLDLRLRRIAAILCARKDGKDAEAFRVLHWCVMNLSIVESQT